MQIQLGQQVKDVVTGFTGIAMSRVEWMNGCVRLGLQPQVDKDGKHPDLVYIDEVQLEVSGPRVVLPAADEVTEPASIPTSPPAGPRADPVRATDPTR